MRHDKSITKLQLLQANRTRILYFYTTLIHKLLQDAKSLEALQTTLSKIYKQARHTEPIIINSKLKRLNL